MAKNKLQINPLTGKFDLVGSGSGSGVGNTVVFYRECNVYTDTWLFVDNIVSNKIGSNIKFVDSQISQVCIRNKNTTEFDLEIYEHDGNLVNSNLITTLSTSSGNEDFIISQTLNVNKQLAARLVNLNGERPASLKVEVLIEGQ